MPMNNPHLAIELEQEIKEILTGVSRAMAMGDIRERVTVCHDDHDIALVVGALRRSGEVDALEHDGGRFFRIAGADVHPPLGGGGPKSGGSGPAVTATPAPPPKSNAPTSDGQRQTRTRWSDEEIQTLRDVYESGGAAAEALPKLPGRTRQQIYTKAHELGLSGSKRKSGKKRPSKKTAKKKAAKRVAKKKVANTNGTAGDDPKDATAAILKAELDRAAKAVDDYMRSCCDDTVLRLLEMNVSNARKACESAGIEVVL